MQKATHNPILYSLISGCVWAVIGFALAWSVSPIRSTPTEVVRSFAGGLVAAPLIGVLVGLLSRNFSRLARSARVMVALANLYLAVWLFLMATSAVKLVGGFVSGPILGALLGLTYTGFVLLLWPLSYVNHTLVSRAWNRT